MYRDPKHCGPYVAYVVPEDFVPETYKQAFLALQEQRRKEIKNVFNHLLLESVKDDLHKEAEAGTALLSDAERSVLDKLADAWNAFLLMEPLHADHVAEFRTAIHSAQYLVMARPVQRQFNKE